MLVDISIGGNVIMYVGRCVLREYYGICMKHAIVAMDYDQDGCVCCFMCITRNLLPSPLLSGIACLLHSLAA